MLIFNIYHYSHQVQNNKKEDRKKHTQITCKSLETYSNLKKKQTTNKSHEQTAQTPHKIVYVLTMT